MSRDDLIHAGEVLKVHGLDGALIIRFKGPFYLPPAFPPFLFLEIDGLQVPFAVKTAEEYGENSYAIRLEDVTTRDKALRYQGCEVWVESKYSGQTVSDNKNTQKDLTGFSFLDETSGRQGHITGFLPVPGNPLFEVRSQENDYLLPAVSHFIIRIDKKNRQVIFRLPEGLFGRFNDEG